MPINLEELYLELKKLMEAGENKNSRVLMELHEGDCYHISATIFNQCKKIPGDEQLGEATLRIKCFKKTG